MLWDIVRDFFVQNIFGGYDHIGHYYNVSLGHAYTSDGNISFDSTNFGVPFDAFDLSNELPITAMSIGDYLSTIFTIITFVLLFIVAVLAVRWCFRIFSRSFKWF